MNGLREMIEAVKIDIITVLQERVSPLPLSQIELYESRKLKNMSEMGWSFAIEALIKENKIQYCNLDYPKGLLKYHLGTKCNCNEREPLF